MMEQKTIQKLTVAFFGGMALFTLLSRAAYQQGTAVVHTAAPSSGTVSHTVRLTGKAVQNQEIAVTTLPGLRVGAVLVTEGQQVEAGEPLFTLDMDYLEEAVEEKRQELRKQQLSVQDSWSQAYAQERARETAKEQAQENYDAAVSGAEDTLGRAEEAVDKAQKALDDYYAGVTGDEEKKAALADACQVAEQELETAKTTLSDLEAEREAAIVQAAAQVETEEEKAAAAAEVEAEYAPRILEAQGTVAKAEEALDRANQDLAAFTPGERPSEEELKAALEKAEEARDQAESSLSGTKRTYGQAVETASLPGGTNHSAQIGQITYDQQAGDLKKLEALLEAQGQVTAPLKGVITGVSLRTGQMTTDTTALLLADSAQGWNLSAEVTQDQSKYIGTGDKVTVRLESSGKEYKDLAVTAFFPKEAGGSLTVALPAADIPLGTRLSLSCTRRSQAYQTCVPLSALHMDAQNRAYVLVTETVNTVLGSETRAAKISVTVLDKNETTAAVEGPLTGKEVIVSADRAVDSGSRVRVE